MLRLTVECGPDAGRIFLTRSIYAVVGHNGEIALRDRSVSDYHALLQVQENGVILVTDLNSETGTWFGYGERPAEQLKLKSGMCFKVGNTVLRVQIEQTATLLPPAVAMPLPPKAAPVPASRPHVLHVAQPVREGGTGPLPPISANQDSPSSSASLELEFDPDILAVSENETQAQSVDMAEPQRLLIPAPAQRRPAVAPSARPQASQPAPQPQREWARR